jgi:hypothetical protein
MDLELNPKLVLDIADMDESIRKSLIGGFTTVEVSEDDGQDEGQYHDAEENDALLGVEDDDLIVGAEVMLPKDGETPMIAKVVGRKRDKDGNPIGEKADNPVLDTREYLVRFQDGTEEAHVLNKIAQALYSELDEEGHRWYTFKEIVAHKRGSGGRGKTKGWLLEILWQNGMTSWETLTSIKEMNMPKAAEYAVENQLEKEPAFSYWVPHAMKKRGRIIKQVMRRRKNNKFKYGIEVPRTVQRAIEIDKHNGNELWQAAIKKEMSKVGIAFDIKPKGEAPPEGYQQIPLRLIFDVKMDFTRKARLVAGGHKTDPPEEVTTYSSVVTKDSVRIAFMLATLNGIEVEMADVGNAYLNAKVAEKVYAIAGPEFGQDQGRVVVIIRALYGLKSAGASWAQHFADVFTSMGFAATKADENVWMRKHQKADGTDYWEYVFVYVDDILCLSTDPRGRIIEPIIAKGYLLKAEGAPTRYLGATIGIYNTEGAKGKKYSFWSISAEAYLKLAIDELQTKKGLLKSKNIDMPLESAYHPEVDASDTLGDDEANYYQSLIGVLQWAVELGRIDIAHTVSVMSSFTCMPREGHMRNVIRVFAYLKNHLRSRLVMDHRKRPMESFAWGKYDWTRQYPGAQEVVPKDAPEALGASVQVTFFVDAAFATNLVNRRSTTGVLIFVNGAPVMWYAKRQNTVESSTYGSEFVALRIGIEMVEGIRYKLRMFGVPLDGPANGFCDNQSVLLNSTLPASTLKKKHNAVNYHKTRESVAAGTVRLAKEPGETNTADLLTKSLSGPKLKQLSAQVMY